MVKSLAGVLSAVVVVGVLIGMAIGIFGSVSTCMGVAISFSPSIGILGVLSISMFLSINFSMEQRSALPNGSHHMNVRNMVRMHVESCTTCRIAGELEDTCYFALQDAMCIERACKGGPNLTRVK